MAAHYSSAMFWEVNPAIASAIGMAGTIVAMGMFLSPVRTFQRIIQRRSTEEFSPFPYASTFLSCSIWLFYSLPFITPDRLSPLLTNCLGVTFELVYLAIFLLFAHDAARKRAVKMVAGVFSFVFCFVFGVLLCIEPDKRSSFIGLFAAVFTVLMYGSPLAVMRIAELARRSHIHASRQCWESRQFGGSGPRGTGRNVVLFRCARGVNSVGPGRRPCSKLFGQAGSCAAPSIRKYSAGKAALFGTIRWKVLGQAELRATLSLTGGWDSKSVETRHREASVREA